MTLSDELREKQTSARESRYRNYFSPLVILPFSAAIVLSFISFHTTYYGMRSFYGLGRGSGKNADTDPIASAVHQYLSIDIENLFAIAFAAIVQGGILLASAYLFRLMLARRHRAPGVGQDGYVRLFVLTILLILLPISILFSYGARLEWQIGPDQKATIQAGGAYSDAQSMLSSLTVMLQDEGQRLSSEVKQNVSFKEWLTSMGQLAAAVARAPATMQSYLKSVESVEADKRATERVQEAESKQRLLEYEAEAQQIRNSIAALDEQIGKLERDNETKPSTTEFDTRISELETEMQKEQVGTGSCGIAGEGACYKRLKAKRDSIQAEKTRYLRNAEATTRTRSEKLTSLKIEKVASTAQLANLEDKARLYGFDIKVDARAGALDPSVDLPRKIEDLRLSVGQLGVDLKKSLDRLAGNFSHEDYARAVEQCQKLAPLAQIDPALRQIDCNPSSLAAPVATVAQHHSRHKKFDGVCNAIAPYVSGELATIYTSQVFERVGDCIGLSGLGANPKYQSRVADISLDLSRAISSRSSGVDYLTFTLSQLREGKRVAYVALFFAVGVDVLVLVFAFLGELPLRGIQTVKPLSREEKQQIFEDLQAVNDAVETSDAGGLSFPRAVMTCLQTEAPDGLSRLDLNRLTDVNERQALRRRLSPFLATGMAWENSHRQNEIYLSEQGMSALTKECRRVIGLKDREVLEPLRPATAAHEHLKRAS